VAQGSGNARPNDVISSSLSSSNAIGGEKEFGMLGDTTPAKGMCSVANSGIA
jgi:hypothetical protein